MLPYLVYPVLGLKLRSFCMLGKPHPVSAPSPLCSCECRPTELSILTAGPTTTSQSSALQRLLSLSSRRRGCTSLLTSLSPPAPAVPSISCLRGSVALGHAVSGIRPSFSSCNWLLLLPGPSSVSLCYSIVHALLAFKTES